MMFFPSDISSRLTVLRGRRQELATSRDRALVTWASVLLFVVVGMLVVIALSYARFSYWSDIDARLSEYQSAPAYDAEEFDAVITKFETRSRRSDDLINSLPAIAATSSATTTAVEE